MLLCIEDAEDVCEIISSTLYSHQIIFANTREETIEALKRNKFDLVLLDISLPDGVGLEVLIRNKETLKGCPVICLTSNQNLAFRASAYSLGVDDFVVKPFDPIDLKIRVKSKIRKSKNSKNDQNEFKSGDLVCSLDRHILIKK